MPAAGSRALARRLRALGTGLVLALQGKRQRIKIIALPDGSSKKKTVITRTWPGVRELLRSQRYQKWALLWLAAVAVCALLIFGEALVNSLNRSTRFTGLSPDATLAVQDDD
ncbi:MAG TPA: hypothetical protein PKM88_01250 [bacterium]|nr:hypothetical protein [bacterium]